MDSTVQVVAPATSGGFPPPLSSPITDLPSFTWSKLFDEASKIKPFPSPTYLDDGTPVVIAPPEILLAVSETWKGYLFCSFFDQAPPASKIFADLNPIWGKKGKITVRDFASETCLIFIPHIPTRHWVQKVAFWSSGTVNFAVSEWTSTATLSVSHLSTAPLWVNFRGIPPQLWSEDSLDLMASGIGKVLPDSSPTLSKTSFGVGRVRVLIDLYGHLPTTLLVKDSEGHSVRITVEMEIIAWRKFFISTHGS